ncbi:MAG TPA: hypothetical protein VKH35_13785 [Thermoanaerobaculia bacterium]|nr:hypothetical protein [Thermoanaerobaculia bacterium]
MTSPLIDYLTARPDASMFLLPVDLARTVEDLFPRADALLPEPYKIFPADETQLPSLGFPLAETSVMKELDAKLDRWLAEEVVWQLKRNPDSRDKAQAALTAYLMPLMKVAENALMSNLLNDYHAVFWLAHSFDVSRQFASIPRRVSAIDTQAGRTQGDALKYRIFSKWSVETRDQMTQIATKAASILDGEEQVALQFFRLLQDDVLILTEEFIGPDLRELRSFLNGYLRRDFQSFRDGVERLRNLAADLLQRDQIFRAAVPFFGINADQPISVAALLDSRFHGFLFELPDVQNALSREDREQFQLIARRLREFSVLNLLRHGILWMTVASDGRVLSADKRNGNSYSRSTRPLDFGRHGVLDPMIHRFGLIYDISNFSETLGNIRRAGRKEEINSYRQMLLFQRRLESIAQRHMLTFEKFLGDGAFYTTRRSLRLVRAAVEVQRAYAEMRTKGFAFNKGLRIALNFGYYRLLPMKGSEAYERINEFYGPGIVELSRLTTGKATQEIEEFAEFLVGYGYEEKKVTQFFAPLAKGVDVIDHTQHAREFYAYVNANGHLINEGIVGSMSLFQELSNELASEGQQIYRLGTRWGDYYGFDPSVNGVEFIGIRLIGMVSLKGLDKVEVGEIVGFAPADVEAVAIDSTEPLVMILRQEFHQRGQGGSTPQTDTTHEKLVPTEIIVCMRPDEHAMGGGEVLIGEWDPLSDDVRNPVRLPRADFQRLFSLAGDLTAENLARNKQNVRETYLRLSDHIYTPAVQLASYRGDEFAAFVLGEQVEVL